MESASLAQDDDCEKTSWTTWQGQEILDKIIQIWFLLAKHVLSLVKHLKNSFSVVWKFYWIYFCFWKSKILASRITKRIFWKEISFQNSVTARKNFW